MKNQNSKVLFLAQAAMIAAIYVVLTVLGASLAFGEVQIRFAEALTILPVFTPAAIPGLFIGCLLGNILGGAILPDIIFGSIATLIGAVFTRMLRNKSKYLAPLPPVVANTIIHRTIRIKICLCRTTSDSIYDADSRSWRSHFRRCDWTDFIRSTL